MIHLASEFLAVIENRVDGQRPHRTTAPGAGTGFSLGASNVEGSYAQFIDGSTAWPAGIGDGFGILLSFSRTSVNAQAHTCLATIGIDLAGGTTYTEWIHDLICGPTGDEPDGPIEYYFPVRVPNGSSLAVKGQDSHATPIATSFIRCEILCKPTRPELVRVGSFVQTFGADTANSAGTAFTPGTTSDGTYVSLGTLNKECWGWEFGVTVNNATINANVCYVDVALGDASNKRRVIRNGRITMGTAETVPKVNATPCLGLGANGDGVYMRGQAGDNAPASGFSGIAYGVGG